MMGIKQFGWSLTVMMLGLGGLTAAGCTVQDDDMDGGVQDQQANPEGPADLLSIDLTEDDLQRAEARRSGEITLERVVRVRGREYPVGLTFASAAEARRWLRRSAGRIDLRRLRDLMVMGRDGEPAFVHAADATALIANVDELTDTLCSEWAARSFLELEDGVTVAVDFEMVADPEQSANVEPIPAEPGAGEPGTLEPGAAIGSCIYSGVNDVDDDCDRFAVGGCGDECRNYASKIVIPNEGWPYAEYYSYTTGACKKKVIDWWPDTCFCNGSGGTVEYHCWNHQTQQHEPCDSPW